MCCEARSYQLSGCVSSSGGQVRAAGLLPVAADWWKWPLRWTTRVLFSAPPPPSTGKQRRLASCWLCVGARGWGLEWCLQAGRSEQVVTLPQCRSQITAAIIMSHYSRSLQHFAAFCSILHVMTLMKVVIRITLHCTSHLNQESMRVTTSRCYECPLPLILLLLMMMLLLLRETMSRVSSQFLPITARSYPGAGLVQAACRSYLLISPPCLHRQGSAPKLVHIFFSFLIDILQ